MTDSQMDVQTGVSGGRGGLERRGGCPLVAGDSPLLAWWDAAHVTFLSIRDELRRGGSDDPEVTQASWTKLKVESTTEW